MAVFGMIEMKVKFSLFISMYISLSLAILISFPVSLFLCQRPDDTNRHHQIKILIIIKAMILTILFRVDDVDDNGAEIGGGAREA